MKQCLDPSGLNRLKHQATQSYRHSSLFSHHRFPPIPL